MTRYLKSDSFVSSTKGNTIVPSIKYTFRFAIQIQIDYLVKLNLIYAAS